MKIQKNSKFYKYLYAVNKYGFGKSHPRYIEYTIPKTVCSLFWFVIFGSLSMVFKFAALAMSIFVGVVAITFIFVATVVHLFQPLTSFSIYPADLFGALLAMLGWLMMGTLTLLIYQETDHYYKARSEKLDKDYEKRNNKTERNERKPNQFIQLCKEYAKAAKDKVCPLIEYE